MRKRMVAVVVGAVLVGGALSPALAAESDLVARSAASIDRPDVAVALPVGEQELAVEVEVANRIAAQVGLVEPAPSTSAVGCSPLDRPETGLQGDVPLADQLSGRAAEGYSCGLSVIGHHALGARGANANMAWAGHCAYIAGEGIAVVDVSDPTAPRQVTTLTTPGSLDTLETLHAVDAGDRSILVAGRYGLFFDFQLGDSAPVDIYDVSDCDAPRLLTTIDVPQSVHNLTLSADARTMWSTLPLQAYDLTDPTAPRYLGSLEAELRAQGAFALEYAHEAWPSADGTRLYLGGQVPGDEGSMIVDIEGWPTRPARVVSRFSGPGHSIREATIGGRTHLLRSEESVLNPTANGCVPEVLTPAGGAAQAFLTDIDDETAPVDRGTLGLAINDPVNCPTQLASGVNASSHYHDVDDPTDTTFAMVSMWNAGLRIFDVRDPDAPVEVAYFNPGAFDVPLLDTSGAPVDLFLNGTGQRDLDQAWAHVRYVPETGHIWLATRSGGFWVLELAPQVRAALDLPALPARFPDGTPPRPDSSRFAPGAPLLTTSQAAFYCTLGRR